MPDARVPAALTRGSRQPGAGNRIDTNGSGSPSPTRRSPHSLGGIRGEDLAAILQFQFARRAGTRVGGGGVGS